MLQHVSWALMRRSWALLGCSWVPSRLSWGSLATLGPPLGCSWDTLGRSWVALGLSWVAPEARGGVLWAVIDPLVSPSGHPWVSLAHPWYLWSPLEVLGASGTLFGRSQARFAPIWSMRGSVLGSIRNPFGSISDSANSADSNRKLSFQHCTSSRVLLRGAAVARSVYNI